MRKLTILLAVALVAMAAVSASAANVAGELGILDVSGTNPATGDAWAVGDQYRLVFLTSTTTDATSDDIATYNAFVQGVATTAGLGGTWNIIGSTVTVDARDNTGTNPDNGIGVPIFRMDGMTAIALTNDDLWDGGIDAFINLDENGDYFIDDRIFTGSETNGTSSGATEDTGLGVPAGVGVNGVQTGKQERTSSSWIKNFNMPETGFHPVYAMSEVLSITSGSSAGIVYPADGDDKIAPDATLTLEWINPDPNGQALSVDVLFGTEPNDLSPGYDMELVVDNVEDATTVNVDASDVDTYYWRVDITIGDANTVEGDIWSFTTVLDAAPIVEIDPPKIMTWSDQAVQLDATIDDNDEADVTFIWTASPDGLDDENLDVVFVATDEDPVVTVTNNTGSMVTVTMTLTATDANGDVQASSEIEVYSDACDMTINGENTPIALTDLNADCTTDLGDLAIMAAAWLDDYASTEPK